VAAEGGEPTAAEAIGGVRVAPERPAGDPLEAERKMVMALVRRHQRLDGDEEDLDP
jgi:hypothetical protein